MREKEVLFFRSSFFRLEPVESWDLFSSMNSSKGSLSLEGMAACIFNEVGDRVY